MKTITINDLRLMNNSEGLILQGCGGDLQEWLDGINELLVEEGILDANNKYQTENVFTFEHSGHTDLLFQFEGVKINLNKLAMWKLDTRGQFGGIWLSDFVPNQLGGFLNESQQQSANKPDCPLADADSNIFYLIGIVSRTLKHNGLANQAKEMQERITGGNCHSYDQALSIIGDYVNITSNEDYDEEYDENAERLNYD